MFLIHVHFCNDAHEYHTVGSCKVCFNVVHLRAVKKQSWPFIKVITDNGKILNSIIMDKHMPEEIKHHQR